MFRYDTIENIFVIVSMIQFCFKNVLISARTNYKQPLVLKGVWNSIVFVNVIRDNKQNRNKTRQYHTSRAHLAGHSKWANIKHKKMHKDNARAKLFGKLSLEIIQAVKENGPDPVYNTKLDALMLKAKSNSMPKEKIETSIKNALRNTEEKRINTVLQVRGPGKCGLLVELLTPNPARSKPEIKSILKKHEATYIEDGSVAFMFEHKGILAVENNFSAMADKDQNDSAEEIAIIIGAEDVLLYGDEEEQSIQFICPPLEILKIKKEFENKFSRMTILSADVQYLGKTLVELSDESLMQVDKLIEAINEHPDVLQVYDNINGYPSKTIKFENKFAECTIPKTE